MAEKPATSDLIELTRGLFASASRKDFNVMLAVTRSGGAPDAPSLRAIGGKS